MAKLFFRYGTMNSGKSTALIQVAYNYAETNQRAFVIKPSIDTKNDKVLSRIGVNLKVDKQISDKDNLFELIESELSQNRTIDCILVDEAQFITAQQAEELLLITVRLSIPVIAYGLRTDFLGVVFPGSGRLLEIAHQIEEIRTKCWYCNAKATFNSRQLPDGDFMKSGEQVLIDDGQIVKYIPLCAHHFDKLVGFQK